MTAVKQLDGLGEVTLRPTVARPPATELALGPEEGFVLSRVDGKTSLEEILSLVPFDAALTIQILRRLWTEGAIDLPGLTRPAPAKAAPTPAPTPAQTQPPVRVPPGVDLTPDQVRRIDQFYLSLSQRDAFELLELKPGADGKEVKRSYFRLSKEFHPDRFFGRELGDYKPRLSQIFQAIKAAFELLADDKRRAAYEESLRK